MSASCRHAAFQCIGDGPIRCSYCGLTRPEIERQIPKRKATKKRNETAELTRPIEAALNHLPGVWCARNTVGNGYHRNGDPATWGLGTGSADVVGCVSMTVHAIYCGPVARFFALEVKWPGKKLNPAQVGWHTAIRTRVPGVFIAVVHSVEEAVAAVERCRRGEAT